MSRIGRMPITIEQGVSAEIKEAGVLLKGPAGEDMVEVPDYFEVKLDGDQMTLGIRDEKKKDDLHVKAMHGTVRSLLYNASLGVKEGYSKKLEIVGVGYRVKTEGNGISLTLGWNHPVTVEAPEDIQFEVVDETTLIVKGVNKQRVGEVAARIRELRKPEPYKGKGIRYEGEYVRRKTAKVIAAE